MSDKRATLSELTKVQEWKQEGILFDVARAKSTETLIVGCSDFHVYEFDAGGPEAKANAFEGTGHESYVTSVARSEETVVSGGYDGRLVWWDAEQRSQIRSVHGHEKWIRMVRLSPDGSKLASVGDDMICRIWETTTGKLLAHYADHAPITPHNFPSMLYAVAISPDGRFFATADKVGKIAVRDLMRGDKLADLDAPAMYTWDPRQRRHSIGGIRSITFSNDSTYLAVGGIGEIGNIDHLGGPHRIEVFDWQRQEKVIVVENEEFKGLVEQLAFHPDNHWLLAAGGDHNGFLAFYDFPSGKVIRQEKAPMHVHAFTLSDNNDVLYAVGHEKIVKWSLS